VTAEIVNRDLTENFGIKYLLTYRINQDVLENYILGRNEGSLSEGGNVEYDVTPDVPKHNIKITFSQNYLEKLMIRADYWQRNSWMNSGKKVTI
jgi:hypothetical protein